MADTTSPRFTRRPDGSYTVRIGNAVAGTVTKVADDDWSSRYGDGSPGPFGSSRIYTAWELINS